MPRRKSRRGRPSLLARLSVAQLRSEMERRREMLGELRAQRDSIETEIGYLESLGSPSIDGAGRGRTPEPLPAGRGNGRRGRRGGKGRGRGGNKKSLAALLQSLLKGRTLSVVEMANSAKKAGHKSKSKNFRAIVSLALLNNRKMFKRVGRGQYTAK